MKVTIDTGSTLEATAGDGVGVFVEYAGEGRWHVWTACDTNSSHADCGFDVFASVPSGGAITNPTGENLEGEDNVRVESDGAVHLAAATSTEFDGMTFETDPGSTVELEVFLDGEAQPHFVYWVGDGVLHNGAPTNPVDFAPNAP
jgi:hypothetical protein